MTALRHWVVCDDYVRGPYSATRAGLVAGRKTGCPLDHRVVESATKPVPAWQAGDDGDGYDHLPPTTG